jgi:hypothetical protein
MYGAASVDARTLECAMFTTEMGRQLEAVLGRRCPTRNCASSPTRQTEAHYWYKYMQGLAPTCAPPPPADPVAGR